MLETYKNKAILFFRKNLVLFLSLIIFGEYTSGEMSECSDKHVHIGEKRHKFSLVI